MRLIDADVLIERKKEEYAYYDITDSEFEDLVNSQPTAFDTEKVVEQLEEAMERYDDVAFMEMNINGHTLDFEYSNGKKDGVEESIDIVKKGGVE